MMALAGKFLDLLKQPTIASALLILALVIYLTPLLVISYLFVHTSEVSTARIEGAIHKLGEQFEAAHLQLAQRRHD